MKEAALIDRLADISSKADATALASLNDLLERDARLRVPDDMVAEVLEKEALARMLSQKGLKDKQASCDFSGREP